MDYWSLYETAFMKVSGDVEGLRETLIELTVHGEVQGMASAELQFHHLNLPNVSEDDAYKVRNRITDLRGVVRTAYGHVKELSIPQTQIERTITSEQQIFGHPC